MLGESSGAGETGIGGSSRNEIAEALSRLYNLFIKICYLKEGLIKWPPHSASELDLEICRS